MQEAKFTFSVTFDKNKMLHFGKHHVVTYSHLFYYKDYVLDSNNNVASKGVAYTQPLVKLEFEIEVPGKIILTLRYFD